MKTYFKILLALFLLATGPKAFSQEKPILVQLEEVAIVDQKVMMPMRDGIRLATDIYRPKGDQKVPVVFFLGLPTTSTPMATGK